MKRPAVRCRCGHQVLAKEVLRTDLYERPSGREYVYVKYRCKRCKRMGETFVAEHRWDWRIFEASQNELSESETERFSAQGPISAEELLDFHRQLTAIDTTRELAQDGVQLSDNKPESGNDPDNAEPVDAPPKLPATEGKPELKLGDSDSSKDSKKDPEKTGQPEDGSPRL